MNYDQKKSLARQRPSCEVPLSSEEIGMRLSVIDESGFSALDAVDGGCLEGVTDARTLGVSREVPGL